MTMIAISTIFSNLLTRYRRQVDDLDVAAEQDDIDRLTTASQAALVELAKVRAPNARALADKFDALIHRFDSFGALPMELVRELWRDAEALAVEPNVAQAWARLWADLGCHLHVDHGTGERRYWIPDPHVVTDRYTADLPRHLRINGEVEARGAAKALQALAMLGGKRMADAVFAYADDVTGVAA